MDHETPETSNTTWPDNRRTETTLPSPPDVAGFNKNLPPMPTHTKKKTKKQKELRSALMVVSVLAAGATYQSAISPPGGLWQANDDQGHKAGMPVLRDTFPQQYRAFLCFNSLAFVSSLSTIVVLTLEDSGADPESFSLLLHITLSLNLLTFMGAYAIAIAHNSDYVKLLLGAMGFLILLIFYILLFNKYYRRRAHREQASVEINSA